MGAVGASAPAAPGEARREMEEQIREAIELLDHANDDHWDARGGKPKLSVVRSLVGDDTITREQVEAAAPGLVRQAPKGGDAAPEPGPAAEADTAPAQAPSEPQESTGREPDPDSLEGQILALNREIGLAQSNRDELARRIDEMQMQRDNLVRKREAEGVPKTTDLLRRARLQAVEDRKALGGRTQLDRAYQPRRGFGRERPQFPSPAIRGDS